MEELDIEYNTSDELWVDLKVNPEDMLFPKHNKEASDLTTYKMSKEEIAAYFNK